MAILAGLYGPEILLRPDLIKPAVNTLVTVRNTNMALATLYTNKTKNFTAPNPTSTDIYGNLWFWVNPGEYIIETDVRQLECVVCLHPEEPPPSAGTGGLGYTHLQSIPASSWQIVHNFGYNPNIIALDNSIPPQVIEYDKISWPSTNITEITFGTISNPITVAGIARAS